MRCRNRDWVLLPSDDDTLWRLRPLTGSLDDVVVVHRGLADLLGYELPEERVRPSQFRLPSPDDLGDAVAARLLWQAARLMLREGAAPLRSLGRISIRPRAYQFVPLLMALRLDPVRMLIADDVGVGKTIEALLIARELWEHGEIKRLAVLCPPYLCDQWQQELIEKFHFHEAVVIRAGTVRQLERETPPGRAIYEHFPVQVISIDWVKSERHRHHFLLHAPELVIVDEAHGAAMAQNQNQQQRHRLVQELAASHPQRHLLLLTATPHSGIDSAFRSLLGLLDPQFAAWEFASLSEAQVRRMAHHFVQRTRRDIERDWEHEACFPRRIAEDQTYRLSPTYHALFQKTYAFCAEIVRTGAHLEERKRRVRYWGALALLRCVMSSPAAAQKALETRQARMGLEESGDAATGDEADERDWRGFVFEPDDDRVDDEMPTPPIERAEATLRESERRKLRELAKLAATLIATGADTKLDGVAQTVRRLLAEGWHPIVWCRYVATAEYVAEMLRQRLEPLPAQVICLTGRQPDEERRMRIAAIDRERPRVLVATDCLSEGINLQEAFNAVIHYDLPWNPNRLEQREGRVDRYGQPARDVRVIRYYGADNPVDGVVIEVLLDKAAEIHRALGTHVPVPEESASVTEAVLHALFMQGWSAETGAATQLTLDLGVPDVDRLHQRWQRDAERERITRTRFAQRALKPAEVQRELEAIDAVLGDAAAVKAFALDAAQRLHVTVRPDRRAEVFRIAIAPAATAMVPEIVRATLPSPHPRAGGQDEWLVSFVSPTPAGATYLGRNHPFIAALAQYLFEEALADPSQSPHGVGGGAVAARCGVIRSRAVARLTTLWLLRARYLIHLPNRAPLLAEEVRVAGYVGAPSDRIEWLPDDEALALLASARPDANVPIAEKRELAEAAISAWPMVEPHLTPRLRARAAELAEAHKRIRQAAQMRIRELRVEPTLPPDALGLLVVTPLP